MKISDIYTAKGLKFKLTYLDASARFSVGALVSIESTQNDKEFLVKQYGAKSNSGEWKSVICKADKAASDYLADLFETEKVDSLTNEKIEIENQIKELTKKDLTKDK